MIAFCVLKHAHALIPVYAPVLEILQFDLIQDFNPSLVPALKMILEGD